MKVRLLPSAQRDLLAILGYCSGARPGLERAFLGSLQVTQDRIRRFPHSGTPDMHDTRRARIRGFPYALIYRHRHDEAVVLAISHLSRRSSWWSDRVQEAPPVWLRRPMGVLAEAML